MKRDDDLLRAILLFLEEQPPHTGYFLASELEIEGYDCATVGEHGLLVVGAGWATGHNATTDDCPDAALVRLTMEGHDFLAAIRDDTVWQRTKDRLASVGGGTIDVIKGVAIAVISETLKSGG